MIDETVKALIQKYDQSAPRYTSYPTAPHFTENFTDKDYGDAIYNLDEHEPVSVYIHIPFCHSLCHYCGCNTKVVHSQTPIEDYVDALCMEIENAGRLFPTKKALSKLHFGGGSPNYANTKLIQKILKTLEKYFVFDMQSEIDMECDPRLLTKEKIDDYMALGVQRVSLGIQDFNEGVQEKIHRIQPFKMVERTVELFRKKGLKQINFDLVLGLPGQSLKTFSQTLDDAIKLAPSRFAVFPYAHVPWMKKHQVLLEKFERADEFKRYEMMQLAQRKLVDAQYQMIGIDHFARAHDTLYQMLEKKQLRRNFQGYSDDQADIILGFGLSSISDLRGAYAQNMTDPVEYYRAIKEQKFPVKRGITLSREDQIRRALINHLMCYFEVDLKPYKELCLSYRALLQYQSDGLLTLDDYVLRVTPLGKDFVRLIASSFDAYFQKDQQRHAKLI